MATAVSGTGPAYVFLVMEALIDAAVHLGFPRHIAHDLVIETLEGSTRFAKQSGDHPAVLRNMVTSPAGTSAAAIHELESGRLRTVLSEAVWAAFRRTVELGDQMDAQLTREPAPDAAPGIRKPPGGPQRLEIAAISERAGQIQRLAPSTTKAKAASVPRRPHARWSEVLAGRHVGESFVTGGLGTVPVWNRNVAAVAALRTWPIRTRSHRTLGGVAPAPVGAARVVGGWWALRAGRGAA